MPVEEAVRSVPACAACASTFLARYLDISINFDWGQDMVARCCRSSPPSQGAADAPCRHDVRRAAHGPDGVFPGHRLRLHVESALPGRMRDIAYWQLRRCCRPCRASPKSRCSAARRPSIESRRSGRLEARGLALADVSAGAVGIQHDRLGRPARDHYKLYLAIVDDRALDERQIGETVLLKERLGAGACSGRREA